MLTRWLVALAVVLATAWSALAPTTPDPVAAASYHRDRTDTDSAPEDDGAWTTITLSDGALD